MSIKVNLISLGCSKNLVNSEQMLAKMLEEGMEITSFISECDVCIINTCGFIESAKKEAIDHILDVVSYKKDGKIKGVVVTGCLTERYKEEVFNEIPEVDAILGTGSYDLIVDAVKKANSNERVSYFDNIDEINLELERAITTSGHSAFIKISEGCNNRCSFCIIPKLRGKYRSRSIENIVREAEVLAENGTKEIILIAQDVTRYGKDIYKEYKLTALLEELCKVQGIEWIRLHYLYPELVTDELIDFIANNDKILNYFDMPMQHINDRILKLMKRRGDREYLTTLVSKIRSKIPNAVLRTSLIVGLPTETEEEFKELCEFLEETKIERAGVFAYSREEDTEAYDMEQIAEDVKLSRQKTAEEIVSRIIDSYNENQIGKNVTVLVDGFDEEFSMFYGRSFADSLDIDGKIFFESETDIKDGTFVNVEISELFDPYLKGILKEI